MSTDYNYLSCSNNIWGFDEGGPNPLSATADAVKVQLLPDNPTQFASILKLCDNSVQILENLEVGQGRECSVDINNHANIKISGEFGTSINGAGNQIFSVKGGSTAVIAGTLKGAGNRLNADILVDNWSDQCLGSSSVDLTNAKHETGRNINIVYRFFASKVVGGPNIKRLYWQSLQLTAYWWLKRIVRMVMHIKIGVSGPNWL